MWQLPPIASWWPANAASYTAAAVGASTVIGHTTALSSDDNNETLDHDAIYEKLFGKST